MGTKWYRKAADQGNAGSQFILGMMCATGKVVPEDDQEAAKWLQLAADQGDARAQTVLGLMYGTGEGVPKNDQEAAK